MRKKNRRKISKYKTVVSNTFFKVIILIFSIVVVLLFVTGGHGTIQLVKAKIQLNKLKKEKVLLENKSVELKTLKDSLKNNPKTIEKIAREKYNMVKKGEDIYQIEPKK